MSNMLTLIKNGGQMVTDMEEVLGYLTTIVGENMTLRTIVEQQGAVIVTIKDELGVVSRKLDELQDEVTTSKTITDEIKHTKFIGQEVKVLKQARELVGNISGGDIRRLIHRAAKARGGRKGEGYTYIYDKLFDISGFNVYDVGKITLKKTDGIDGWKKDPSYINAILKEGYGKDAAVICKQVLADK